MTTGWTVGCDAAGRFSSCEWNVSTCLLFSFHAHAWQATLKRPWRLMIMTPRLWRSTRGSSIDCDARSLFYPHLCKSTFTQPSLDLVVPTQTTHVLLLCIKPMRPKSQILNRVATVRQSSSAEIARTPSPKPQLQPYNPHGIPCDPPASKPEAVESSSHPRIAIQRPPNQRP